MAKPQSWRIMWACYDLTGIKISLLFSSLQPPNWLPTLIRIEARCLASSARTGRASKLVEFPSWGLARDRLRVVRSPSLHTSFPLAWLPSPPSPAHPEGSCPFYQQKALSWQHICLAQCFTLPSDSVTWGIASLISARAWNICVCKKLGKYLLRSLPSTKNEI